MEIAIFALFAANALMTAALLVTASKLVAKARAVISAYLQPGQDAEGKPAPSEAAKVVQSIAEVFASTIVRSIKAQLMNAESLAVRQENKAAAGVVTEMAGGIHPILGALMSKYPKMARKVASTPGVVDWLMNMLTSKVTAKPPGNNHRETKLTLEV